MIALPQREDMVADIEQAGLPGPGCAELGLSARTFEQWQRYGVARGDGRPAAVRPEPAHELNQPDARKYWPSAKSRVFTDLPPAQIVPRLADEGSGFVTYSNRDT